MGNEMCSSKPNKNAIEIRVLIDQVLQDKEPYAVYLANLKALKQIFTKDDKNLKEYTVSYLKQVLESSKTLGLEKFNALLFLKDLMKTKDITLVKEVD